LSLPEGNRSNQVEQEEVQRRQNEKRIEQGPKIPFDEPEHILIEGRERPDTHFKKPDPES